MPGALAIRRVVLPLLAAAAFGCGSSPSSPPGPTGTGGPTSQASCDERPTPPGWTYPPGPYGTEVSQRFADFTLDDCDLRAVRFADWLSEAELVLVNVGAGWCQPCIEETRTIMQNIYSPFCGRGLRIVQIMFEDERSRPATSLFCRQWRDAYMLTFPVLIDPTFDWSRIYFAGGAQTPLNLLVDKQAVIRYRSVGVAPADLAQRIDALLPR